MSTRNRYTVRLFSNAPNAGEAAAVLGMLAAAIVIGAITRFTALALGVAVGAGLLAVLATLSVSKAATRENP